MDKKNNGALVDGIQSALAAFLIMLGISLILSIAVNFSVYEQFNELMSGTLGDNKGANISSILKITIIIFNMSLFNAVGNFRLSIIVLAAIPGIAFWISNKRINGNGVLNTYKLKVYGVATLTFAFLQWLVSFITKGELVEGLAVNFASIRNMISTVIIIWLMQLFILMNTKSKGKAFDGIKAFRHTYRTLAIIGAVVGLLAIIFGLKSWYSDIVLLLFVIIFALPNIVVYSFFYMSGLTMAFNEELQGGLNYLGIDPTLQNMAYVRYGAVLVFVIVLVVFTLRMKKDQYFYINTFIYSVITGVFFGVLGYYSSIYVSNIPVGVDNIEFSVSSYFLSAFIPFAGIWIIALIYYLIKKMKTVISQ